MADELELDLNEDNQEEIISRKDKRIESLSEKYKLSEKEKAELAEAKAKAEAEAQAAKKEAEFFKSFNQVSTKYQGASEYQDKIREKAALGLDVEEATLLVMAKEGKYTPPEPKVERESPAGGSATTNVRSSEKSVDEMTQAERLAALKDMEARGEFKL